MIKLLCNEFNFLQRLDERRQMCESSDTDLLVWNNSRLIQWVKSIDLKGTLLYRSNFLVTVSVMGLYFIFCLVLVGCLQFVFVFFLSQYIVMFLYFYPI